MNKKPKHTDPVHLRLTIREYGRRISCSHVNILQAIKERKIIKGFDLKTDEIIVPFADEEWGNAVMARKNTTPQDHRTTAQIQKENEKTNPTQKPQPTQPISGSLGEGRGEAKPTEPQPPVEWTGGPIPDNIPYPEALRIKMILDAQAAQLKNDTLTGTLVKKAEINNQLAIAAIEIRKMLERLPSRLIDPIRAAATRNEALLHSEEEMAKTLNQMAEIIEKKINS